MKAFLLSPPFPPPKPCITLQSVVSCALKPLIYLTKNISKLSVVTSVTEWQKYFSIFGHLHQWKFAQKQKNAKVSSIISPMQNEGFKNCRRLLKYQSSWPFIKIFGKTFSLSTIVRSKKTMLIDEPQKITKYLFSLARCIDYFNFLTDNWIVAQQQFVENISTTTLFDQSFMVKSLYYPGSANANGRWSLVSAQWKAVEFMRCQNYV